MYCAKQLNSFHVRRAFFTKMLHARRDGIRKLVMHFLCRLATICTVKAFSWSRVKRLEIRQGARSVRPARCECPRLQGQLPSDIASRGQVPNVIWFVLSGVAFSLEGWQAAQTTKRHAVEKCNFTKTQLICCQAAAVALVCFGLFGPPVQMCK